MNSVRRIRFCLLGGVENVRLEESAPVDCMNSGVKFKTVEGVDVVGQWKGKVMRFTPPAGVWAAEFANWGRDAKSVQHFTQRFGPLLKRPNPGKEFRFPLFEWIGSQEHFRTMWDAMMRHGAKAAKHLDSAVRHRLIFKHGWLNYETELVWYFLTLDLHSCPHERLRKCLRPDCATPYFIAAHLGQRYCNEICAQWAQRKWKLEWWNRNKGKGRKQNSRRKARTGKG